MEKLISRAEQICERIWQIIETILNGDLEKVVKFLPLLILLIAALFVLPKLSWIIDLSAYMWICSEVTTTRRLVETDIEVRRKERS